MYFSMDFITDADRTFRVVLDTEAASGRGEVRFYDRKVELGQYGDNGIFTGGGYLYETMMEHGPFTGLNLHMGVPEWYIDGDSFNLVYRWLRQFKF